MTWLILAAAVVPALLLLWFVYSKDFNPEPKNLVFKGFFFGALSVFASLMFSTPMVVSGVITHNPASFTDAVLLSFLGAAIPEESAKLLMLWLLLRRCKEFDERYDGLVYAAAVGLGFACLENILYVVEAGNGWLETSVVRALFAVPGHFSFAIVMGYYYSKSHFEWNKTPVSDKVKMWAYPVLLHGAYDTMALSAGLGYLWSGLMSVALLVFCFFLFRHTRKRILTEAQNNRQ